MFINKKAENKELKNNILVLSSEAIEAKKRAEEAMQNRGTDFDLALAQSEFAMAAAQLAAIARFRRKK